MKHILWTGGWDSTYRVLDLVLEKGCTVQPYYVLDDARESLDIELETMQNIKKMIAECKPGAEKLIKDHIFINIKDVMADKEITDAYKNLFSKAFLGEQYDWLGRYVKSIGIDNLELCIHKDDRAEAFIRNDIHLVKDGNDSYYKLNNDLSDENLLIFKRYTFPILNMDKVEMGEIAKKNNFSHIMEKTWFCHTPTKDRKPCGVCNPCCYTRSEGLGRRVPRMPMRHFIQIKIKGLILRIKRLIKTS